MGPQTLPRRWEKILVPIGILIVTICLSGVNAEPCRGRCGYRTTCVRNRCECDPDSDHQRSVQGSLVQYCLQPCEPDGEPCPANTTCQPRFSNVDLCDCSVGARRSATGQCLDIDECDEDGGKCGTNSVCKNTEGGYTCECEKGYRKAAQEEVDCDVDIDECDENANICGDNSVCTNTLGNYTCACAEGFRQRHGEEVGCNLDIDECDQKPDVCGTNSVCTNTEGNYTCACAEGYRQREGEQVGCSKDRDECADNPSICGDNSICTNTEGSYTCGCAEGYSQSEGEEARCSKNRDECAENPSICGDNSICTNTEGSYTCMCAEGYEQSEGGEAECSKMTSTPTVSPSADSSALTIGLAVGISGVVLLVAVILAVVVFRARNRSRGDVRDDIGIETQGKHSNVKSYESISDQSEGQQRKVANPTYAVLPEQLVSVPHFRSGTVVRYEEIDLQPQPQAELYHEPQNWYSLPGNFDDQEPSESQEFNPLYINDKIIESAAKQVSTGKSQSSETSPSESTYNVLSKPDLRPSTEVASTTENCNNLNDIKAKHLSTEKSQAPETDMSECTYNVLSEPHVNPSTASPDTPDNNNSLYDINADMRVKSLSREESQVPDSSLNDSTYNVLSRSDVKPSTASTPENYSSLYDINADIKAKHLSTEKSQAPEIYLSESTYNVLCKPNVKPPNAPTDTPDNYNSLYDINADIRAKHLSTEKNHAPETSFNESTYNVLSQPDVKPFTAVANTPDNYSSLYNINSKPTNEGPDDIQPRQYGYGNSRGKDGVQYDTTYSSVKLTEGKFVPQSSKELENGSEYEEVKVQRA